MRRSRLQVGETSTPLIEAGPREATEAIVFVHGNPGSSSDFTALVAAAGDLGRALAFDMPGFGKARAPARFDFSVGGYAQFLEHARAALGLGHANRSSSRGRSSSAAPGPSSAVT